LTPKQPSIAARFFAYLGRRSLRSLLLFVLAVTLLPVFLISFGQAYARLSLDREVVRQNLVSNVTLSAEQALHVIDSGELALISLGGRDDVRGSMSSCAQTLAVAQLAMPYSTNLARINAEGIVTCSAHPILMDPDLSQRSWLRDLEKKDGIAFAGPASEQPSNTTVLIMGLALKDREGTGLGQIVLGIDLEKLESSLQRRKGSNQARLILVDQRGTQVRRPNASLSVAGDPPILDEPGGIPLGAVTTARDKSGKLWSYARKTLVPDRLFVAYTMPDDALYASTFRHVATDIALPLMALILGGAGLWFAAQLWAIKPIEDLRALARQYSVGHFDATPPTFAYGPIEMRELRDELYGMAVRAVQRDGRLKRVAHQKDDLVKELHHRVKNNLQIVISLISLQARQLSDPSQKAPLERVHARILAMALVERLIIEKEDNPTIDACLLLEKICSLVRRIYQSESLRVKIDFECEHVQIQTDKASALALFTFEAITNAFRHGFPEKRTGQIHVRFVVNEANVAALDIRDTGAGWTERNKMTGTGHKLLQAFARQLGGQFDLSSHAKDGSRVSLTFVVTTTPNVVGDMEMQQQITEQ
jgi:two-component sensor histidine kinase